MPWMTSKTTDLHSLHGVLPKRRAHRHQAAQLAVQPTCCITTMATFSAGMKVAFHTISCQCGKVPPSHRLC